ncbi:MAG: ATP synthase F0 subunit B [Cyanobacteria bacterium P01_D01_bin.44]
MPLGNGQMPLEDDAGYQQAPGRFDVLEALNQIEELILDSPRVPMSGRTLINEDEILDQLDSIRLNLPRAFQESTQLLQQRDEILADSEQYAQEIVSTAEKQAAAILNDMAIIRQAEQQAQVVRSQTEQEAAAMRTKTLAEIEQLQRQARQEWEDMRSQAIAECQAIHQDADAYADQVLQRMESQFSEMLGVLRNGRQQLYTKQQRLLESDPDARRELPTGQPPIDPRQRQQMGIPQPRQTQPMQPPRTPRQRR